LHAAPYDPFSLSAQHASGNITPPPRSNTGIIVAGGFAVLGLLALLTVFMVTR
jgi:hypothetical protein